MCLTPPASAAIPARRRPSPGTGLPARRHPLASPVFGDYTGISPLLIQVGEHEMLRDDSVGVAARARSDGTEVTLEVWPGMAHVFQIRGLPESREAIERIAGFMQSCMAR